jgi:hypothetical protein
MGRELLTKLSKHILKDGRSDILNLQIYSERWKMLGGEDLDWFWRGWFYSTDA